MHQVFRLASIGSLAATALLVSACQQMANEQPHSDTTAELAKTASAEASPYPVELNFGDLQYLDKLLSQRELATEAHRQEGARFLEASLEMAAEDKASDFEKGYEGIAKMHCPPAMIYPTNEALIVCAESELVSDLQSTSRVDRFRMSARIYHAVLAFSEAVDEPLSARQRQAVETNVSCLDAFPANAVTPSPTCELAFTTLR